MKKILSLVALVALMAVLFHAPANAVESTLLRVAVVEARTSKGEPAEIRYYAYGLDGEPLAYRGEIGDCKLLVLGKFMAGLKCGKTDYINTAYIHQSKAGHYYVVFGWGAGAVLADLAAAQTEVEKPLP